MPPRAFSAAPSLARAACLGAALALAAGCGSDGHGGGAGDAGYSDSGGGDALGNDGGGQDATADATLPGDASLDAGASSEAGEGPETGAGDAAGSESGASDAGASLDSSSDAGGDAGGAGPDASAGDAGPHPDGGATDAGVDSGAPGAPDAGTDSGGVGSSCIADAGAIGVCVQKLGSTLDAPRALAVNASGVYWITVDSIQSLPLAGGSPSVVTSGVVEGNDIAIDAKQAFWAQGDGVYSVPLGGGARTTLVNGQIGVAHLTLDATTVYFTTNAGTVSKIGKSGAGFAQLAGRPAVPGEPGNIVVNATSVFFTSCAGDTCDVDRCGLDGSGLTTLASNQFEAFALTLDASGIYWVVNSAPGVITKLPFGATQLVPVARDDFPSQLATDGTTLYFPSDSSIMRMPVGGAVTTPLVNGQSSPQLLVIDATAAYWFDHAYDAAKGEVYTLMKAAPR